MTTPTKTHDEWEKKKKKKEKKKKNNIRFEIGLGEKFQIRINKKKQ